MKLLALISLTWLSVTATNEDSYLLMQLRYDPAAANDYLFATTAVNVNCSDIKTKASITALMPAKSKLDTQPGWEGYCQGYTVATAKISFQAPTEAAHAASLAFYADASSNKYNAIQFADATCMGTTIGAADTGNTLLFATQNGLLSTSAHGAETCVEAGAFHGGDGTKDFCGAKLKHITGNNHIMVQLQGPYNASTCDNDDGNFFANSHVAVIPLEPVDADPTGGVSAFGGGTVDTAVGKNMQVPGLSATDASLKTCEVVANGPTGVNRYWTCDAAGKLSLKLTQGGADDCATPTRTYEFTKDYMFQNDGNNKAFCVKSIPASGDESLWMKLTVPVRNADTWCTLATAPTCAPAAGVAGPASTASLSMLLVTVLSLIALLM